MAKIIYLVKPVENFVELHATTHPVGGIFTPVREAVNPFPLLSESKINLTNVYFTIPPEERDGRVLWRYVEDVLDGLPASIKKEGYKAEVGHTIGLRLAKWSLGTVRSDFGVLGLTDENSLRLPTGGDMAILQMKNEVGDKILASIEDRDGFEVVRTESTEIFDQILKNSKVPAFFETLEELQRTYEEIGPEGILKKLSEQISLEGAIMKLEDDLGGRDPKDLSSGEAKRLMEAFFSRGGNERNKE